jgi:NAD(P)-dependent dehydrogenase (short-subunit alcohol dehydrogenase family)
MSEQTIALVTGANTGIGYEIAVGLCALGWRVGVGARDEARREEAVEKLRAGGADAFGVALDVTSDSSLAAAVERFDRLDVLVNNAGVTGGMAQEPGRADLASPTRSCRCCARPRHRGSSICPAAWGR